MEVMERDERKRLARAGLFTAELKTEIVELCWRGDRSIGRSPGLRSDRDPVRE